MTIERTAAKIGLRMKKWEKFMAIPPSVGHGSLRRTFPQFRLHHDSRTHAHQSFNDDLFTWLQPFLNHTQAVDHWADLYRAKLNLLLCVDYIDKFLRLIRTQGAVRDEQRRIFSAARDADAPEESRTQAMIGIGKHAARAHRSRAGINPVVHKIHIALVWKAGFIRQSHLGGD